MKEFDNKIIELFHDMGRGQGINDSLFMTIFAKLYMSPDSVAIEDLAKDTGYSLASVSNKAKMLMTMPLIKRIRKPKSKKLYLYMEKDILKVWKEMLLKKQEYVINGMKEKLPPLLKEYKNKVKTDKDKQKLKIMEEYNEQVEKFGKVIKKALNEIEKIE